MAYLVDTNVASRRILPADPQFPLIVAALTKLHNQGESLHVTPQVLIEFHALATRPLVANGWGMSPAQALLEGRKIESIFPILPDTAAIYPLWRNLVGHHQIMGRQVFDARLVAVTQAHQITHILTMNPGDFRRFPGIIVVEPSSV